MAQQGGSMGMVEKVIVVAGALFNFALTKLSKGGDVYRSKIAGHALKNLLERS